jgi:hypothetical protein
MISYYHFDHIPHVTSYMEKKNTKIQNQLISSLCNFFFFNNKHRYCFYLHRSTIATFRFEVNLMRQSYLPGIIHNTGQSELSRTPHLKNITTHNLKLNPSLKSKWELREREREREREKRCGLLNQAGRLEAGRT